MLNPKEMKQVEILLKNLDELEKSIQKLSVIDEEQYSYFNQEIQEIRSKLIGLEDTNNPTLQQEIDIIITNINRLKIEFSNYMQKGDRECVPGKLFFELPEQNSSKISGNEKIKRHKLGLLESTVELVKKDVQLDFSKVEQAIAKFNTEKNNTDPQYSPMEIAYIDRLIAELFIEYQRKYYQKNGILPIEEPSTYCNMDTYEAIIRAMASEKLIEEKDRIRKLESLILDGQVVNSNEIWNMLSGEAKGKEGAITTLNTPKHQMERSSNQLVPVKGKKRINNDLILLIRKKNIFGNLVEKTKRIKLDVNGGIYIPKEVRLSIVRAVLPEGIRKISQWAFHDCINMSEVFLPESVIEIGPSAFQGCSSLKNITLPDSLTYIASNCFRNSGLQSIKIPESVIEIGASAFGYCSYLREISLQEGLKQIGREAFSNTGIEKIKIPDSIEIIGDDSFKCPYLDEISLPKSLKNINLNSICGNKVPEIVVRRKDVVPDTGKKSISIGLTEEIDRE